MPYPFWSAADAQSMSMGVFYNGATSSGGTSLFSHLPCNYFPSGSRVHDASKALSVDEHGSRDLNLHSTGVANQEIIVIDSDDDQSENPPLESSHGSGIPHSFANAPSMSMGVFYDKATSSGGTSQFSHIPCNDFPSGSGVHNASKALSVDESNADSSEILKKLELFKKFDIVQDPSDHHYVSNGTSANKPSKNWSKRIQEEWKILEKDLPDTILVRAYEPRMDLLRAVIVGLEGTPYHDGLFFFDVYFPDHYPYVPPQVYYHSGGHKVNPNLSPTGELRFTLLNTWQGRPEEMWIPNKSTMLQVLVSIQGLILNAKPYFNEGGLQSLSGKPVWEWFSHGYNGETFIKSLQTMLFILQNQPMHFEDFVVGHFFKRATDILVACKAYTEGAQIGCVRGGVQDVDVGDKSCSAYFRKTLHPFIKRLVDAFTEIGVEGCEQFVPPAITGTSTTD
ncbi:putative ubiquitin-conjugating enzyme E2 38 [Apium graveolens]|uniref:putative ubiquitin-conjugating enzyme E2 38 n=1 Tax=Apium graveolens TaxID=4045 RepID=UPI003D7B0A78